MLDGIGRAAGAPVQRAPALRRLRPGLRRSDAGDVLVQQPGGRLRELQGLRADDGHRSQPGGARPAPHAGRRLHQDLPDRQLQGVPGRSAEVLPAGGHRRRRRLAGPDRGRPQDRLGGRAGRAPELAHQVVRAGRVLPLAGGPHLQDARARAAVALPALPAVRGLRRVAAEARGAGLPAGRAHAARAGGVAHRRGGGVLRAAAQAESRRRHRAAAGGDPGAA